MYFLMTNDVECTSIVLNREDPRVADEVYRVGLPRLLDLLSKYDVESTFYFTGNFVELKPEAVDLVKKQGHEIGCHGYSHNPKESFDILSSNQQVEILQKAKRIIEDAGAKVNAFRAPEARINEDTVKALETMAFTTDSSISPQRLDGPFSYGFGKKIRWLTAPRSPYFLSYNSIVHRGNSNILEIPISALIVPFIGTAMRITPTLSRMLQKILFFEAKKTSRPIVFLFHPNECIDKSGDVVITKRSKNIIGYVFADVIRHRLKLKNLGKASLVLLEKILNDSKDYGFEFISVTKYRKLHSSISRERGNIK